MSRGSTASTLRSRRSPARVRARRRLRHRRLNGSILVPTGHTPRLRSSTPPEVPPARTGRRRVLAYCIPSLLTLGVVASWFEPGHFWATGDMPPFERRSSIAEAFSIWGHQLSSAGGPSYDVARLPELAMLALGDALGLGPEAAQRLFVSMVAASGVACVVYFAFAFSSAPVVAAAAGLLSFFNVFVLQRLPNVLSLWAVLVMALLGGVLFREARAADQPPPGERVSRPFLLGVCSITASYLALNPPLLASAMLWVLLCVAASGLLWGRAALHRAGRLVVRATPWVAVLNLWWLLPFSVTLLASRSSIAAETSVAGWSWTHARNSLSNVATLSGTWAWDLPDLFPYAERLDRLPWGALRFALPVLAASALVLAPRTRRQATSLIVLALPLVFVGKGLHPPIGGLNAFLYDRVPAMYLFREPLGKVGPMLLLIFVALCALALHGAWTGDRQRPVGRVLAFGMVGAALAYPAPLWTGEVVTAARGPFPSSLVSVPEDWKDIARHLDGSPRRGKVLVLPLDDFYMMPTTWGYYGADVIPRYLLGRPAVQPLSESYFGDPAAFGELVARTEQALLAGDVGEVPRLLDALGVGDVLVRKDIDRRFPGRSLLDPELLDRGLERVADLDLTLSSTVADVWSRSGGEGTFHLAATAVGSADDDVSALIGASPPGTVTRAAAAAPRRGGVLKAPERTMGFSPHGGPHVVDRRLVSGQSIEVRTVGEPPTGLELHDAAPVRIDGVPVLAVPSKLLNLPAGDHWAVTAGGRVLRFDGGRAHAIVRPNDTVSVFDTAATAVSTGRFSDVGDCHASDGRGMEAVGIRGEVLAGDLPAIRLQAREHAACSVLEVPPPPTGETSVYRVRLEYRTESGRPARVCLYRTRTGRCEPVAALGASEEWTAFDEVVVADPAEGRLEIFVYADGDAVGGMTTVTEYRGVVATAHPARDTWTIPPTKPRRVDLPPGHHVVRVAGGTPTAPLTPGPVGDCNAADERSLAEVGIEASSIDERPPAVRLRAREHIGCIALPVGGAAPEARTRVSLDYRTVAGHRARICLYQVGPDRCAAFPALEGGDQWQSLDHVFLPEPGTRSLQLLLYADGGAAEPTTVEYRDVQVGTTTPFDVVVVPAQTTGGAEGPLTWRRDGPAAYTVEVPASPSPRTVVLTESYAPAWTARTDPPLEAEHFRANGYANAWQLAPGPQVTLTVAYAPNRLLEPALALSAAAALVGGRLAIGRAVRRLRVGARSLPSCAARTLPYLRHRRREPRARSR
jgi:arabinofuranan 3-O-arabinosyltransferase